MMSITNKFDMRTFECTLQELEHNVDLLETEINRMDFAIKIDSDYCDVKKKNEFQQYTKGYKKLLMIYNYIWGLSKGEI